MARRGDFRDLYGNGLSFGVAFEHRWYNNMGWGVFSGFEKLSEDDSPLSYWTLSVVPTITRTLTQTATLRLDAGAGFGLSYREISVEFSPQRIKQDEFSPVAMLMTGVGLRLSNAAVIGTRIYYDHHFFSDPKVGKFGDTGGFHIRAFLGLSFQ